MSLRSNQHCSFYFLAPLAVLAAEGIAFWWTHPPATDAAEPVLVWQRASSKHGSEPAGLAAPASPARQTPTDSLGPDTSKPWAYTAQPHLYARSAPMLRCSRGEVWVASIDEGAATADRAPQAPPAVDAQAPTRPIAHQSSVIRHSPASLTLHLAFLEWDAESAGSVLEAFRHMPEACMGSIGLGLVSREPGRKYVVDGHELVFDHTIFRDPVASPAARAPDRTGSPSRPPSGSPSAANPNSSFLLHPSSLDTVHAFRAVWVSGLAEADARDGLFGHQLADLRAIRVNAARHRFRPSHARVVQGAVRGAPDGDTAWQAFEQTMLKDLAFE